MTARTLCLALCLSAALVALVGAASPAVRMPLLQRSSLALDFSAAAGPKLPLSGGINSVGEFYAKVSLGTPPQNITVQLDTGSTDLLVYSDKCQGCGPYTRRYNFSQSTTGVKLGCDYETQNVSCFQCYDKHYCGFDDQYGDGSGVQGYVGWDVLSAGGLTANITFGAIEEATSNFEPNGVEGIWGLAYRSISSWSGLSGVFELENQNGLPTSFAMCLKPSGAYFEIGTAPSTGISYTPIVQEQYYAVQIKDMLVGKKSLGLKPSQYGQTIVDSGTTLLVLPGAAFKRVYHHMKDLCKEGRDLPGVCGVKKSQGIFGGYCVKMSEKQRASFPDLKVKLSGTGDLSIDSSAYLVAQQGYYCLGIANGGDSPGLPLILGDVFMRNKLVVFDAENKQVGFGSC